MASWDQETTPRSSRRAMDSGVGTADDVFDGCPQKTQITPRPESVWESVNQDILGVVLRFLPCHEDRAAVRSVCRHWHTAAQGHGLPQPLPLLLLPEFRFSCLRPEGTMTAIRRGMMPEGLAADDISCVGSSGRWFVGVTRKVNPVLGYYVDSECFLVNAFSHEVIRLPRPGASSRFSDTLKTLPVINDTSKVHCKAIDRHAALLIQVVLSAPPDPGSKFIVAASSFSPAGSELSLWRPGMTSWLTCTGDGIQGPKDLAFYEGKLYLLHRFSPWLLSLEFEEDDGGFNVSRVERCATETLFPNPFNIRASCCNMVVWRGRLLLIIRRYDSFDLNRNILEVKVLALELRTYPYGFTEIHSFDGDCIFVGQGGSKSFPAGLYNTVEGDHIYFLPYFRNPWPGGYFVYNMRDGVKRPFASSPDDIGAQTMTKIFDYPVWLFPPE